jgi:transcription elongation GreA/GreB family factor
MSRAFVKESDESLPADELPERPLAPHPNYVTPAGLAALRERLHDLQAQREDLKAHTDDDPLARQRRLEAERDLRYVNAQIERAIVVNPAEHPGDEVHFGAHVTIRDEAGREQTFAIVGDDEADLARGKISWASPLAKALIGARTGDTVTWPRPDGAVEVEVAAIAYPQAT